MKIAAIRFAVLVAFVLCAFGCGTERDIFGSLDNVPHSGVAPYTKVDLDAEAELVQPFVLLPASGEYEFREPTVLIRDGVFHMWVEIGTFLDAQSANTHVASEIYYFTSQNGFDWTPANDSRPVLTAERAWENGLVGAPTVIHRDGGFAMWYVGGDGAGIAMATSPDGVAWTRISTDPVLVPTEDWENGMVSAPCVLFDEGMLRLWYSAGTDGGVRTGVATGRSIGYATSDDGLYWTKSAANPVLTASQDWETSDPDSPGSGYVSSPTVVRDETVARTIYRMWYTGNVPGDPFFDDASVGYAGSLDGASWEKAESPVNPVLQELFPLDFQGISEFLLYDEAQPCVVRDGDLWIMYFVQVDALNLLSGGLRGVAVATNPSVTVR